MEITFSEASVKSTVKAISSKSEAHRNLICAALADRKSEIICTDTNADIDATVRCLNALGAEIIRIPNGFSVTPINNVKKGQQLDCNESGSTLRFMLPLCSALGANCEFLLRGRLSQRPLSPLYELLQSNGITLSPQGNPTLTIQGKLGAGYYRIAANISSQYISGMLFALSVTEGVSTLTLEGKVESEPYIEMTVVALSSFSADIGYDRQNNKFTIQGKARLASPRSSITGGDWSNAAFFLAAGAIGKNPVTLTGLDPLSAQGDKEILSVLEKMGATIVKKQNEITVFPSELKGITVDASQIPDLVPVIATVASVAEGETTIINASRLRLKESDRIDSVCNTLGMLGAIISPTEDGMTITGQKQLRGGVVHSHNDHRIAMSAAIASLVCNSPVTVKEFEAINKSYPSFLDNFNL